MDDASDDEDEADDEQEEEQEEKSKKNVGALKFNLFNVTFHIFDSPYATWKIFARPVTRVIFQSCNRKIRCIYFRRRRQNPKINQKNRPLLNYQRRKRGSNQ